MSLHCLGLSCQEPSRAITATTRDPVPSPVEVCGLTSPIAEPMIGTLFCCLFFASVRFLFMSYSIHCKICVCEGVDFCAMAQV